MTPTTKTRTLLFALALGLAGAAQAQVISYSPRSGDIWIDTELGYFNDYGRQDRGYFVDDIVGSYGAPRYLVNELLEDRRWDPGDVYYASALAYQLRRPLSDVVRERDRNRGQGWGVIAQRMGIKPGSAEFHNLKKGFVPTYDRWGRPISLDNDLQRAYPNRGKSSAGKAKATNGKAQHGNAKHHTTANGARKTTTGKPAHKHAGKAKPANAGKGKQDAGGGKGKKD